MYQRVCIYSLGHRYKRMIRTHRVGYLYVHLMVNPCRGQRLMRVLGLLLHGSKVTFTVWGLSGVVTWSQLIISGGRGLCQVVRALGMYSRVFRYLIAFVRGQRVLIHVNM